MESPQNFDAGSQRTKVPLDLAKSILGESNSTNIKEQGAIALNNYGAAVAYRYPFAKLTFQDVSVSNPNIAILDGCRVGLPPDTIILGIETLRQLRIYLSYNEQKLFLTLADAR